MEAGTKIKDHDISITSGEQKKLSELCGPQGLILYFYPKDNTPGCTVEACDFRDQNRALGNLGYGIAGVSGDSIKSHQNFTQKQKLNFPLIADEDLSLAKAFGAWGAKKLYGKTVQGMIRSTFILDGQLKISRLYKNVRAKGHVERLLKDLK